jgi:hypothetical protein
MQPAGTRCGRIKCRGCSPRRRLSAVLQPAFGRYKEGGDCPIFYDWIHDKLDEALARAPSDATLSSELTFRVPTANRLDEKLDVTSFFAAKREKRQRARMLTDAIAGTASAPPTVLAVEQLATNITLRGASSLESALGQTETPWASPEPGTTPWHPNKQPVTD